MHSLGSVTVYAGTHRHRSACSKSRVRLHTASIYAPGLTTRGRPDVRGRHTAGIQECAEGRTVAHLTPRVPYQGPREKCGVTPK